MFLVLLEKSTSGDSIGVLYGKNMRVLFCLVFLIIFYSILGVLIIPEWLINDS